MLTVNCIGWVSKFRTWFWNQQHSTSIRSVHTHTINLHVKIISPTDRPADQSINLSINQSRIFSSGPSTSPLQIGFRYNQITGRNNRQRLRRRDFARKIVPDLSIGCRKRPAVDSREFDRRHEQTGIASSSTRQFRNTNDRSDVSRRAPTKNFEGRHFYWMRSGTPSRWRLARALAMWSETSR
jgi:hypothetical protein